MHPLNVIIKPVLSEKSNDLRELAGKYTFVVRKEATKNDVKKAVKQLWDVNVASVNTLVQRGKIKRRGMNFSKPTKTKKVFVTLEKGATLPLFEDQ